ncbi:MAG: hypothetical protein N2Z85_00525 [Patescibacteria group bacterium]|nr:hypothetical protein [Patescibacteria group bacterium]
MEKIILSKKTLIFLVMLLILILGVSGWIIYQFINKNNQNNPSDYVAVFLETGDIYFGKIDWFPWPKLKNVWYIQRTIDNKNQVQLGILPFKNSFWSPIDKIYLNPSKIVFWTYLRNSSELIKAFENPEILNQLNNNQINNFNDLNTQNKNSIINNNPIQTSTNQSQ